MTISAGFYVERNALTFFSTKGTDVPPITLTSEVIQDLRIVSEPALERIIKTWMEQNKILPTKVMLVLANSVTFSTDLSDPAATIDSPEVQAFLDLVPFKDVTHKVFRLENSVRATATNQHLIDPLIFVLEQLGFSVLCVAPAYAINIDDQTPFSKELGKQLLDSIATLMKYNFISQQDLVDKLREPQPFLSTKIDMKLIGMVGLFLVLLAVLGILLVLQS